MKKWFCISYDEKQMNAIEIEATSEAEAISIYKKDNPSKSGSVAYAIMCND